MKNKFITLILFFTVCFFVISCSKDKIIPSFDVNKFESDEYQEAICFDLANDRNIFGGVISKSRDTIIRSTIILPFEMKKVEKNSNSYNTWSTYERHTFIDYSIPDTDAPVVIDFLPKWSGTKDKDNNIFWITSGLRRTFVYQNKAKINNEKQFSRLVKQDFVAINLPENAEVFESRNKNNEILKLDFEVRNSRFFSLENLKQQNDNQLQIEYMVEAANSQKEKRDFFMKLAGILLIPILQLLFMDKELADDRRKKVKKIFIGIGIIIHIVIFITIGYLACVSYQNGEGIPYFDLALLIIGGIIEGAILWMKMGAE